MIQRMSYYKYIPDSDRYDSLVLHDSKQWELFNQFDGRSLAASWLPVEVRIHRSKERGDFPSLASHVPVFTVKAFNTLRTLICPNVEVLPIKCNRYVFCALNVLDVLDVLDTTRSDIVRFSSGEIMDIEKYAFFEDRLRGKHLFKIRELPLSNVFVSEEFKNEVENQALRGLIFGPVG
jgi:hypothetical protein